MNNSLIYIFVDTKKIAVIDMKKIIFRNRETFLINDKYRLGQNSKIGFICSECGEYFEQLFRFKDRFVKNEFKCTDCLVCFNAEKNGGFNFQKKEIQQKVKKTLYEKYGEFTPAKDKRVKEKTKQTNLDRYGVEYVSQNKDIKEKAKQTNLDRYGVEYVLQSKEIRNKICETNLYRYGFDHHMKKRENVCNFKKSMLNKYGVDAALKNKEFHKKQLSSLGNSQRLKKINENLHYQNKSELECINYCLNNNINIYDGPYIKYNWNDSNHTYHVDFETNNYIIEVKGNHHWYKEDLQNGKINAKNNAAIKYANKINKKFLFLLDIKNYSKFIRK